MLLESLDSGLRSAPFEDAAPLYFAFSIVLSLVFVLVSRLDPAANLLAWAHSFIAQVLCSGALIAYGLWHHPGALVFCLFFGMANAVLLLDAAERFKYTRHSGATLGLLAIAASVSILAFATRDIRSGVVLALSFRIAALLMAAWLLWRTSQGRPVGLRISSYTLQSQALLTLGCLVALIYFSRTNSVIPHSELIPFAFLILDVVLALGLVLATTERTRDALLLANQELRGTRNQLETLADTDPLTGCFNRRVFRTLVDRRQAEGKSGEGALFLVDIDDLKSVNDALGHAAGDAIIRKLAEEIKRVVRSNELVIRWGGDEFLVVLEGLARGEVEGRRRAMAQSIASAGLKASIGVAPFGGEVDLLAAVDVADRGMYAEKTRRKGAPG